MSPPELRVGLIDSGVTGSAATRVVASRGFRRGPEGHGLESAAVDDRLGHGTALAEILLGASPACVLLNAQVFTDKLSCSAHQVAAALAWLVDEGVQLVNMSFGLREYRTGLRAACDLALEAGVVLVAAAPARGEPVFPAGFPGVIRATGDARCSESQISCLATAQADFGGHVRAAGHRVAGASVGCANVSARAIQHLASTPGVSAPRLRQWLATQASYHGPERRVS